MRLYANILHNNGNGGRNAADAWKKKTREILIKIQICIYYYYFVVERCRMPLLVCARGWEREIFQWSAWTIGRLALTKGKMGATAENRDRREKYGERERQIVHEPMYSKCSRKSDRTSNNMEYLANGQSYFDRLFASICQRATTTTSPAPTHRSARYKNK